MSTQKKYYHYFVSGFCRNEPFMNEILLPKKICSYDGIYYLKNECTKKHNVYWDDIVIINYKLLWPFKYK